MSLRPAGDRSADMLHFAFVRKRFSLALIICAYHLPLKFGDRFSLNDLMPSRRSSVGTVL